MAPPAHAQLRRDAVQQHPSATRVGEALLGIGFARVSDVRIPLSGLTGRLTSLPVLHAALAVAPRVVLEARGAAWRRLAVTARDPDAPLPPADPDAPPADVGDFEVGVSFAPLGSARGFSAGGYFGVTLPNSDESRGIGSNTTDVSLAGLFSWGGGPWRATGRFGVDILEAPAVLFEQNDVFAYAVEMLWGGAGPWRASVSARGRAGTRRVAPVGTEDEGEARAALEWRRGAWRLDAGAGRGFTPTSGGWSVRAGVALERWPRASSRPRRARAARDGR